jgi:Sulfotransferase family
MRTHTFICGCGHSGTSLVAAMLAAHPEIHVPLYESEAFLVPDEAPARWARLRAQAAASGRPHFAEKTPRHLLHLDAIRAAVPGARFVILVRDGRDVAASFIKRHGAAAVGARRWLKENPVARAESGAGDVHILRYEDLIAAPEAALRVLAGFAGFRFAPEMLRYHEAPRLWFGVDRLAKGNGANGLEHRMLRSWQINQPLFDDRGKWRRLLAPEDLAPFEAPEGSALMRFFGYA